ncbi:hypothetical protein SIID45300_02394 [Candidatus Magnetaquicoccaceae bacterium FCR-1]|uniref:PhiE125 gp8 family phage protein n=1 Tax=Candidatus Magnetaquiglobus chichijimensis TaxID=3141448 RepID=A0ABQ0CAY9_9PROT
MALTDLQSMARRMTRTDEASITAEDIDAAIRTAIWRYSMDRARVMVAEIRVADGPVFALPDGWEAGFSVLATIEHGDGELEGEPLPLSILRIEETAAGWRMRLTGPVDTSSLRLRYTVPHRVTQTEDTLAAREWEAVSTYAAAHLLEQIAAAKSGDVDPSFGADTVSRSTPASEYAARSKQLFARYREMIGTRTERTIPAGVVVAPIQRRVGLTHGVRGWV